MQDASLSPISLSARGPALSHTDIPIQDGSGADHFARNFSDSLPTPPVDATDRYPQTNASTASNLPDPRNGVEPADSNSALTNKKTTGSGVRCGGDDRNPSPSSKKLKSHQLLEGQRRLAFVLRARELRQAGLTWLQVERALRIPAPTLIRWLNQVAGIESPTASQCSPQNHKAGRPPKYQFTEEQSASIRSIALGINRNYKDTSLPEAVRRSIAAGLLQEVGPVAPRGPSENVGCNVTLPPSAQDILERSERGLPLLTDALRSQIALSETEIRAYRSPNEANLDYVQSPGSLMLTRDAVTGEERFWQPGEAYTIDDGSINFGCCVPLERPGDKCWEKFGVIVGRFQFIPTVDHRTRAILGFSYTARPRDSYRAEDLTAAMHTIFAEHGLPRVMFLEYGVSNSRLVNETLARAGVEARHIKSPHEKVVEKAFDLLWTKLSSMPGQIGRFRGEMEEENCLLTACKQGHKDPREYFPSLPQVLSALRVAVAEQNSQWMNSAQYGRWQPGDWFARDARKTTRKLAPQDAWMFSPVITRPLTVRGFCVQTSVPMMPGFSLKFHFGAEFMGEHVGDDVILHFNPFAPDCEAMVVHARTGKVLGPAQQINRHARFTRRIFGYGADPDIGHIAARKHAQALHRTMVAIKNGGAISNAVAETRDGLGNGSIAEVGKVGTVPARQGPPRGPLGNVRSTDPVAPSAQDARAASAAASRTRSRLAQIANQLREEA